MGIHWNKRPSLWFWTVMGCVVASHAVPPPSGSACAGEPRVAEAGGARVEQSRGSNPGREESWRRLSEAWTLLGAHLAGQDERQRDYWRRELDLDRCGELVERGWATADPDSLRAAANRFYQPLEGLENPNFRRFRKALDDCHQLTWCALTAGSGPETESACLEEIEYLLQSDSGMHDTETLGRYVSTIVAERRDDDRVTRLRELYRHPNLFVEISKDFISNRMSDADTKIDQWDPVSTTILGARVRGRAHTVADVSVQVPANPEQARLAIEVRGTIRAPNNVAVREPAVIRSSGTTRFTARTELFWNGVGFESRPVEVNARTRTSIRSVRALSQDGMFSGLRDRLVSTFGTRQAERMKPEADREASREARRRITEQIERQVAYTLDTLNAHVEHSFRVPLQRIGMYPEIQAVATDEAILVSMRRAGLGGLSAPEAPRWEPADGPMTLAVHQSALNNFLCRQNGGSYWTDKDFADVQKQLHGENSYEFRIGLHEKWSVVFASQCPLSSVISSDGIKFRARVGELQVEDRKYAYPFEVEASYRIGVDTNSLRLVRDEAIDLTWIGDPPPDESTREELEEFVDRKFSGFFLEETYLDGLAAPAGGQWSQLSKLRTSQIELKPGWMRLTFDSD